MKVKELIEKLQEMDPELPVVYSDGEVRPGPIDEVSVRVVPGPDWHYDLLDDWLLGSELCCERAVVLE